MFSFEPNNFCENIFLTTLIPREILEYIQLNETLSFHFCARIEILYTRNVKICVMRNVNCGGDDTS